MALSQDEQKRIARVMQHLPAFGGSMQKTIEHLNKVDRDAADEAERRLTEAMNQSREWDALHGG